MTLPEDTCPHEHLWRGSCVDCLTDVAWPDRSTVGEREASTRRALAGVRLRLAVYGSARYPWTPPTVTESARTGPVTQSSRVSRVPVHAPLTSIHGHSRVFVNVQVRGLSSIHGCVTPPAPSRAHGSITGEGKTAGQSIHGSITAVTRGGIHGFPPLSIGGNREPGP